MDKKWENDSVQQWNQRKLKQAPGLGVISQKQAMGKNAIFNIRVDRYIRTFLVYL